MKPQNKIDLTEIHLNSIKVVTCDGCTGRKAKKRIEIKGNPTFCPDCGYALFYELIQKTKKVS